MDDNLLTLAKQALGGDFPRQAGQYLRESEGGVQSALNALLPAVIGGIAQSGTSPGGPTRLLSLLTGPGAVTGVLNNVGGLFKDSGAGASSLMKTGAGLVTGIYGDKSPGLVKALSTVSGLRTTSIINLLALIVPLVLGVLKKFVAGNRLDAGGLASLLRRQGYYLQGALDSRVTGALGFTDPAALVATLASQVGDTVHRSGAAVPGGADAVARGMRDVVVAERSAMARAMMLAGGLVFLLLLWRGGSAPVDKPEAMLGANTLRTLHLPEGTKVDIPQGGFLDSLVTFLTTHSAAAHKAFVFDGLLFSTGSAMLDPNSAVQVRYFGEVLKAYPDVKVSVDGHTDNAGDAVANRKLSQERAESVKSVLVAMGLPAERIATTGYGQEKPITSNDSEAGRARNRRVEVLIVQR